MSGDDALAIAERSFRGKGGRRPGAMASHTLCLGELVDPETGETLDEVMLAVMRGPRTYTRMDTVEVYTHGGGLVLRRIMNLFIRGGARLAEPGEFTKQAFLNGRIDLTQAEAVMDLIRAKTEAGHRAALAQLRGGLYHRLVGLREEAIGLLAEIEAGIDFSEEDLQFVGADEIRKRIKQLSEGVEKLLATADSGKAVREGVATVIIGRPNVGKSSLLNALLMEDRAIVTPIPGTTRDVIEEVLNMGGVPLRIMDTAGLRKTDDSVEQEGVVRTRRAMEGADLVLLVLDATRPIEPEDERLLEETREKRRVIVLNKVDCLAAEGKSVPTTAGSHGEVIGLSARSGEGLDQLRARVVALIQEGIVVCGDREAMINQRHREVLLQAGKALALVAASIETAAPAEAVALDLRTAVDRMGEVIGVGTTEDLLDRIFKGFCIGK